MNLRDCNLLVSLQAYNTMLDVTQYIVYLYPVINPFIYSLMHQNFKNGFRVTFPCFFKEEVHKLTKNKSLYLKVKIFFQTDMVLRRGHGARAYVWSRTSVRHTIHATTFEANVRRARLRRQMLVNRSPNSQMKKNFSVDDLQTICEASS